MKSVVFIHRDGQGLIINEDGSRKNVEIRQVNFYQEGAGKLEVLFKEDDEEQLIKLQISMSCDVYEEIRNSEAAVLEHNEGVLESVSVWRNQTGRENVIMLKRYDIMRAKNSMLNEFFVTL